MPEIKNYFSRHLKKQVALPSDHGSWVFLLSPLLIGIFTAQQWSPGIPYLILGLLAAFFLRQPVSYAVKVFSNRRSRKVLPAALFWLTIYSIIGFYSIIMLVSLGHQNLLWLTIPGGFVFIWHLWLVSQRLERYRMGVDIIASGTLALSAPAAYWLSLGASDLVGWVLWILVWLQSAASIVYAFLRLEQRKLNSQPDQQEKIQMGKRALLYSSFNFVLALLLGVFTNLPNLIWLPYLLQLTEVFWGTLKPAVGFKPTRIGLRQFAISIIFTFLFIIVWIS
jgi:hypothetical protein